MVYTKDIITPANTSKSQMIRSVIPITPGLVYRFELEFPTGPCGLLYVSVWDGGYQVWPSTPGEWFHSDGIAIGFDDCYWKDQPPYEFQIYTFNLDEDWEHWCQLRIGMVTKEEFIARFLPSYAYREALELLEKIREEQESRRRAVIERGLSWVRR